MKTGLSLSEWEALCDGCGKCCDIGGGVACPKLDHNNRCTSYETRTKVERCVKVTPHNLVWLHKEGVLPDSCAYVRASKGLGPVSVEYKLLPFLVAHPEIQTRYLDSRARHFRMIS